jgi:hypothetical protein
VRVAALYVEKNGVYAGLPDVELWDEERDARLYEGPWPVVAHPPCNRWCVPLAYVNQTRYGYKIGDDGGCFEAALQAVRAWGGVLEHPRDSVAFKHFGLPRPRRGGWTSSFFDSGVSTVIDQWAYGHPCKKETWLYYIGPEPPALDWRVAPDGLPVVSWLRGAAWHREHGRKALTRADASRTPEAFRDVLLEMARSAAVERAAA